MFCPKCGKPTPANANFCPNCKQHLPKTLDVDSDQLSPDTASHVARAGFEGTKGGKGFLTKGDGDVPPVGDGQEVKEVKPGPIIIMVILTAAAIMWFLNLMFGEVRNCVGSINGAPECSDCSSKLMPTMINGRSVGKCTANYGTGNYDDQCTLNCPGN